MSRFHYEVVTTETIVRHYWVAAPTIQRAEQLVVAGEIKPDVHLDEQLDLRIENIKMTD